MQGEAYASRYDAICNCNWPIWQQVDTTTNQGIASATICINYQKRWAVKCPRRRHLNWGSDGISQWCNHCQFYRPVFSLPCNLVYRSRCNAPSRNPSSECLLPAYSCQLLQYEHRSEPDFVCKMCKIGKQMLSSFRCFALHLSRTNRTRRR